MDPIARMLLGLEQTPPPPPPPDRADQMTLSDLREAVIVIAGLADEPIVASDVQNELNGFATFARVVAALQWATKHGRLHCQYFPLHGKPVRHWHRPIALAANV